MNGARSKSRSTPTYIGDHDPSGRDIERSIRAQLIELSGRSDVYWQRLAVEAEHFAEYNIIPLVPKTRDTGYRRFVDEYGPRCAEVEAIPADALRAMVRDPSRRILRGSGGGR